MKYRRSQISQNEEKSVNLNNEKSRRSRLKPSYPGLQNNQQSYSGPPTVRPSRHPLSGSNVAPLYPRSSALQPPHVRPAQQHLPDNRSKSVKRPSPSPSTSPGQAIDLSTFQHPPPNQGQSPQLTYPPYPQSYWSTPPPGEGSPPTATAGLTESTSQSAGLRGTRTQSTGLRGTGTGLQHAGLTGTRFQSAGLSDYEQQGGHGDSWQP